MMKSVLAISERPARPGGAAPADAHDEPRISGPFPARVKGVDACGRRFKLYAAVENLSAQDCLLSLAAHVERGQFLCIAARVGRALITARGEVSSAAQRADGQWDVAVRFARHRFVHNR
jgi:hypothetical protein